MNENGHFAMVPKAPSAIEKAEPGAKRILSGMVADTLALVRKAQATKPVVSVVACGYMDAGLQGLIGLLLQKGLGTQSSVEPKYFTWTTDFLNAARQSRFDLFILLLNPGIYSRKDNTERALPREPDWDDHGDEINAYELIARLKREFDKPVFVISNEVKYSSSAELAKAGADAIFWMPFGPDEFQSALQRFLKVPCNVATKPSEIVSHPHETRLAKIVIIESDASLLRLMELVILKGFENVAVQTFQVSPDGWAELLRADPDMLIVGGVMPGLSGEEIVRGLMDRNTAYPIVVISGWPPTEKWVRECADTRSNISFLRNPLPPPSLLGIVESSLNIRRREP